MPWQDDCDEGWDPTIVRRALRDVEGLVLQPREFLSRYKLSYYPQRGGSRPTRRAQVRAREQFRPRLTSSTARNVILTSSRQG